VLRVAALSIAIAIGLGFWVAEELEATGGNPGPLAVIGIVIAGFAITVFVFHLSRIGPALRLRTAGLTPEVLRAHLAELEGAEPVAVLEPRAGQRAVSGR